MFADPDFDGPVNRMMNICLMKMAIYMILIPIANYKEDLRITLSITIGVWQTQKYYVGDVEVSVLKKSSIHR